jgi:hypothetical protein
VSNLAKRIWISLVSAGGIVIFVVATLAWALQGDCDDVDYATLATVSCQSQGAGHSWAVVQDLLILAGAGAMLAAIGWAIWKARFLPLAAASAFSVTAFVAVFLIGTIQIGPDAAPRLSDVSVSNPICGDHCAGGLRVAFTTEHEASVSFDFNRAPDTTRDARRHDYVAGIRTRAGASPQLAAIDFAPGRHVVDVELAERSPDTGHRQPLSAGLYSLVIDADLPSPVSNLNQSDITETEARGFTVVAARRP